MLQSHGSPHSRVLLTPPTHPCVSFPPLPSASSSSSSDLLALALSAIHSAPGSTAKVRYVHRFLDWCSHTNVDPRGAANGVTLPWIQVLITYASFVRNGGWNEGDSVSAPNVQAHLRGITSFYTQSLLPDPLAQPGFPGVRIAQLTSLTKIFAANDGPVLHKNPVPASAVVHIRDTAQAISAASTASLPPLDQLVLSRIGDLCECAFLLLWRPSEYTGSSSLTHDSCLDLGSISFLDTHGSALFADGKATALLPEVNGLALLPELATQVCINHGRQKNGQRDEWQPFSRNSRYDHQDGIRLCPVKAAARLVTSLLHQGANADTRLSSVSYSSTTVHVTAKDISSSLKSAVAHLGEAHLGIQAAHVSAHSLRTGGGFCYHVSGIGDAALRILGRWRSDAFISYIRARTAKTGASASLLSKDASRCRQLFPFSRSKASNKS